MSSACTRRVSADRYARWSCCAKLTQSGFKPMWSHMYAGFVAGTNRRRATGQGGVGGGAARAGGGGAARRGGATRSARGHPRRDRHQRGHGYVDVFSGALSRRLDIADSSSVNTCLEVHRQKNTIHCCPPFFQEGKRPEQA